MQVPDILEMVQQRYGVRPEEVLQSSRGCQDVAWARHVAMHLCVTRLGMSFRAVGRAFGRDRTTVRHACRRVERTVRMAEDTRLTALEMEVGRERSAAPV